MPRRCAPPAPTRRLESWLKAHLGRIGAGDYFAVLAYLARDDANTAPLQKSRLAVRDRRHVATCLEFGPRFLHSTGQAYKGGPDSGVFLQITADDAEDLPIPGTARVSASSKRRRRAAISTCCWSAAGARCGRISKAICKPAWPRSRPRAQRALT